MSCFVVGGGVDCVLCTRRLVEKWLKDGLKDGWHGSIGYYEKILGYEPSQSCRRALSMHALELNVTGSLDS